MVKKVEKPVIKPFETGETVTLLCGGKFKVDCANSWGANLDVTNIVTVFSDGKVLLPVRGEALESLKLLVKRAEKTFQKR